MRMSILGSLVILALAPACQSTPGGTGSGRPDPNLITLEELEDLPVTTAREAIQRLRPSWLRARVSTIRGGTGTRYSAAVFRDGMPRGGLETLDEMDIREIGEMRFMSASDATNRYGTGYPGGIIEVFTRRVP